MTTKQDISIEVRDFRNGSWFWIQTHVWRDKRLGKSDKIVYATLASYADVEQEMFPSVQSIANEGDISRRQVFRCLKLLETYGYISVERISGSRNVYRLVKTYEAPPEEIRDHKGGDTVSRVTSSHGRGDKMTPGGGDKLTPLTITNITKTNNNTTDSKKSVVVKQKCPNMIDGHKGCVEYITSFGESRDVKYVNFGKQIGALHKILKAGYTFADIDRQIDGMEKYPFWKSKGFDLTNVASELERGGKYAKERR